MNKDWSVKNKSIYKKPLFLIKNDFNTKNNAFENLGLFNEK